ncbi:MAG: hypothetical protein EA363_08775 [Balneolaceae bacterium]|nr:MAG: hypothetical protein EA363_08775 [Balneolaceae bacterium]
MNRRITPKAPRSHPHIRHSHNPTESHPTESESMLHTVSISAARYLKKSFFLIFFGWMFASCSTHTGEAVAGEAEPADRHAREPVAGVSAAINADFPDESSLAAIYELFSEYDREDAPGCAVAVYRDGEMAHSAAFGMANLDYGIPLTDSSRFYMASVSKQVTAAAAALLVVRGELGYDAAVSDYLDDWPEWASEVRVKHLFNHTSGLPDIYDLMDISGISLSNVMDLDDYMALFYRGESLKNRPGTSYSYTNSGYTTLAKLVETVSGKRFSEFVESELLEPLGMTATHFHDDRLRVIPNRVISYAPADDETDEADEVGGADEKPSDAASDAASPAFRQTYLSNFQGVGPGGLYSSLKDWKHWESFWMGDNTLPDDMNELRAMMTRREVVRNDTLAYALGLDVETWQGARMEGHSGSFMGFKTDVRRFPQHGLALLTLCNREDANPGRKNREMAKILLQGVFEAFLAPYQGIYHNEELQVDYELAVEDGSLKLIRRLSPRGVMNEEAHDKWRAGSWDFVFQRDDEGQVTGFLVSTGRAREVEFVRKAP